MLNKIQLRQLYAPGPWLRPGSRRVLGCVYHDAEHYRSASMGRNHITLCLLSRRLFGRRCVTSMVFRYRHLRSKTYEHAGNLPRKYRRLRLICGFNDLSPYNGVLGAGRYVRHQTLGSSVLERGQTKQRVEDLHFCLYERPIHPELFHIHRVKRIQQSRYSAEIWVVGLAHVVTVQCGNRILTELVVEDTELLPKAGLATSFRFRGERDHSQTFDDDLTYILSTQVERLTPQLFPATHRDYVYYARNRGLFESFDQWASDGLAPFSFIDFDARDDEFHVYAYHAFPEELTLLKTQSIFEFGRKSVKRRS